LLLLFGTALGAQATPFLVKDIQPGTVGSAPAVMTELDGVIYFRANDGTTGAEIWRSNGTAAGTYLLKDVNPGSGNGQNGLFWPYRGRLYYYGGNPTYGFELMATDGTADGTKLIRDIDPGSGSGQVDGWIEMDGILYFRGWPQSLGGELWRTDGTTLGTGMVKDLSFGSNTSLLFLRNASTVLNGMLLYSPSDGATGYEVWRTYGSAASTTLVKDINPGSAGSSPQGYTAVGTGCVFSANDGTAGADLWFTDGTSAGTTLLKDINPGATGSSPGLLVPIGNTVLFRANDGVNGIELWRTDGTAAGTTLVKDIYPGATGSNINGMVAANGVVFFFADDGTTGLELWRTDGTTAGTSLVADINPGSAAGLSSGSQLVRVGDGTLVAFAASDSATGVELWVSDGTAAGTKRQGDINPGAGNANPVWMAVAGSFLYFQADDGTNGPELWALPIKDLGATIATTAGAGCQGTGGIVPQITRRGLPTVGNANFGIGVSNVQLGTTFSTTGALLFGLTSGQFDLGQGCVLSVPTPLVAVGRNFFSSSVTLPFPIPTDPAVLGTELFSQWAIKDAGAPNGAFCLTPTLRVLVGR